MNASNKSIRGSRAALFSLILLAASTRSLAAESGEAGHQPPELHAQSLACSVRLTRALERTDPRHPLSAEALQAVLAYGSFVEFLPLERIVAVRGIGERIEIDFDCGRRRHLDVELPDREEWVHDREDDNLRRGRAKPLRIEGRTLRIRDEIHLHIRNGEIASIREGDIQVVEGFLRLDIELSTLRDPGRLARAEDGRILLARDEQGTALSIAGEWVPQRFDRWVRVAALGREAWIGVEPPRSATPYLAKAD